MDDREGFIATGVGTSRHLILAAAAVFVSTVFFLIVAPVAAHPLWKVPAFVPAYESALVLSDLLTAAVLFGQYSLLRSRGLYVLAFGYVLAAFLALAHELSFPAVFSAHGLFGGSQTSVWLYVLWHAAFPFCVVLYALQKVAGAAPGDRPAARRLEGGVTASVLAGIGTASVIAATSTLAVATPELLPVLVKGNTFTPLLAQLITGLCALCLAALVLLWRRKPRSVLDLWLMVVMCVWIFDMSLGQIFNAARYDAGWYAGRIYGLLASFALLILLMMEGSTYYKRLLIVSERLEQLSQHDGLTGIANRRYFDTVLATQMALMRRQRRSLGLVLCDVDFFKAYNDRYGHQAGDECLKRVADALKDCCRRPSDIVARYGGEEFVLVLPETDFAGATLIAEKARQAVAALRIPHAHSTASPYVSISGGISAVTPNADLTPSELIGAADMALFQAKHLGRDRMAPMRPPQSFEAPLRLEVA